MTAQPSAERMLKNDRQMTYYARNDLLPKLHGPYCYQATFVHI